MSFLTTPQIDSAANTNYDSRAAFVDLVTLRNCWGGDIDWKV